MYPTIVACWFLLAGFLGQQPSSPSAGPVTLNYEFYKTKVQPIFLAKRPGHARCISCHARAGNNSALRLLPLSPGNTTWDEDQSRKNFEAVKITVIPGEPENSRLLTHPLAEQAGGDLYHSGGKHFFSQTDPEWQTLRAWVLGQSVQ